MSKVKYPIGGYAPGPYQNHCAICNGTFIGDKLAMQCLDCAIGMTFEEKDLEIKRYREALEGLIADIRRKPNDTRYATAIKIATEALNKQ